MMLVVERGRTRRDPVLVVERGRTRRTTSW